MERTINLQPKVLKCTKLSLNPSQFDEILRKRICCKIGCKNGAELVGELVVGKSVENEISSWICNKICDDIMFSQICNGFGANLRRASHGPAGWVSGVANSWQHPLQFATYLRRFAFDRKTWKSLWRMLKRMPYSCNNNGNTFLLNNRLKFVSI